MDSSSTRTVSVPDSAGSSDPKDILDVIRSLLNLQSSSRSDMIKPAINPLIVDCARDRYIHCRPRFAAIIAAMLHSIQVKNRGLNYLLLQLHPAIPKTSNLLFPLFINVWLKGDQYYLLGDWRYMKYPQSTFGLGSNAHLSGKTQWTIIISGFINTC